MRTRSAISVPAAAVLAAGLAFGVPAAAGAATTAGHGASPQVDSSDFYIYTNTYERGTAHKGVCHAGQAYHSYNPVESVRNNCEYRLYLYQHRGAQHGWQVCVSPHSDHNVVTGKYHAPAVIRVGTSSSKC